jgi:hypothetical protein
MFRRRPGRRRSLETEGQRRNLKDCTQFKAAWERFAADDSNLTEFLNAKRPALGD